MMVAEHQTQQPVSPLALWFGFLGGPAAWAIHIGVRYPLVPLACRNDLEILLHAVTLVCLSLSGASFMSAFRVRKRTALLPETSNNQVSRSAHAMARMGMFLSFFFMLTILAEALPTAYHDPCTAIDESPGMET